MPIPSPSTDWTSFYIANREASNLLRLFKRTHLKDTDVTASATNPKPSLIPRYYFVISAAMHN